MNDGLDISNGKFIAFIDSDDVWDKKKLEKQIKVLEKNENLIIWTEGEIINEKSVATGQIFTERIKATKKKKNGNIFNELLYENFIFKSSLIFKKKNIGNLRFNERLKLSVDYQFEVTLACKYHYYFINEPLTKYRIHGTNTTIISKKNTRMRAVIIIQSYFLKKYSEIIPNRIKLYLCQNIIASYIWLTNEISIGFNTFNQFKLDLFRFIYNIKNENKNDTLLIKQKRRIFHSINQFRSKSLKKFIMSIYFIIRFKNISKSLRFWANLFIFCLIINSRLSKIYAFHK